MSETSRHERAERGRLNARESFERLSSLLGKVAEDVSAELRDTFGAQNLIDSDCAISMEAFHELNPEMNEQDVKSVEERERVWAGVANKSVRDFRVKADGLKEDASDTEITERYLKESAKEKSKQLEMMMTVLLHKAFGERYLVARSAKYDDYFNGVDNVIVNKKTGDVICAFDEVRENKGSNRREKKDVRVLEKAQTGGAEIIYGFTIENGKAKKKSMSGLPLFCLGINEEEHDELAGAIEYDGESEELNDTERAVLEKIVSSIKEQRDALLEDPLVQRKPEVVANLNKVEELLAGL